METKNRQRNVMRYVGLGTQWMVLMLLGVWAGINIDKKTGWKFPLFTVLLPLTALIYCLWKIIQEFSRPK